VKRPRIVLSDAAVADILELSDWYQEQSGDKLACNSESYPKPRRNQFSFHRAPGVQYRRPVMKHPTKCLAGFCLCQRPYYYSGAPESALGLINSAGRLLLSSLFSTAIATLCSTAAIS
jgi:hypothetical protein